MNILFAYKINNRELLGDVNVFEYDFQPECNEDLIKTQIENVQPGAIVSKSFLFLKKICQLQSKRVIDEKIILIFITKNTDTLQFDGGLSGPIHFIESFDERLNEIRVLQYLISFKNESIQIVKPRLLPKEGSEITFVGAGIVNLVTALFLVRKGYSIKVYSADPEPYNEEQWHEYGCTLAGNDARIFSFNESRQHHYNGDPCSVVNNDQYRKIVEHDGWLSCPIESLDSKDWEWIKEYESYPQWLFEKIQSEIVDFNKESYEYWKELVRDEPNLFKDTGYNQQLFRVYCSENSYIKGKKSESAVGSVLRELNAAEINEEFACLQNAIESKDVAGILEVSGFGINVHKFMLRLISRLQEMGVHFYWNEPIHKITYTQYGNVKALQAKNKVIVSDYYVLSPGVPMGNLLDETASKGQIGAMVGCWLTLPNDELQLKYPLKVARKGYASIESAAGANVIPGKNALGEEVIYISSGHGFIGTNPKNIHEMYIRDLSRAVHETAECLFPTVYQKAKEKGLLEQPARYCIRPWTPSCLGIFETISTVNGGLLILTGGHNTGGFAHSPVVAMAVINALNGQYHPMHHLYHPNRLRNFFSMETPQKKTLMRV